ncbi:MAG: heme A synthase, partial [Gammaproteobacteria bacterium]|nr:heme A synthase [Gammaproteobacteria bacterium]
LWAAVTVLVVVLAVFRALRTGSRSVAIAGWCILAALGAQVILGISNVRYGLPLPVAVAHNGTAAALLLSVVTLVFFSLRRDAL